jgi:DNA-binding response OmpR family regulator
MTTILLVEDDKRISLAMTMRLKSTGFSVVTAQDAPSALIAARRNNPDIVLLDIGLPGGNGIEVAQCLRKNVFSQHVPIIFITASKKEELKTAARRFGASAYLEKPFKASTLLAAIDDALLSSKSWQHTRFAREGA